MKNKRITAFLICAAAIFSLCACGQTSASPETAATDGAGETAAAVTVSYAAREITLPEGMRGGRFAAVGDRIIFSDDITCLYSAGGSGYGLYGIDLDGSGALTNTYDLALLNIPQGARVRDLAFGGDGTLYVTTQLESNRLYALDVSGAPALLFSVELSGGTGPEGLLYSLMLARCGDGAVVVGQREEYGYSLREVDAASKSLGEKHELAKSWSSVWEATGPTASISTTGATCTASTSPRAKRRSS